MTNWTVPACCSSDAWASAPTWGGRFGIAIPVKNQHRRKAGRNHAEGSVTRVGHAGPSHELAGNGAGEQKVFGLRLYILSGEVRPRVVL